MPPAPSGRVLLGRGFWAVLRLWLVFVLVVASLTSPALAQQGALSGFPFGLGGAMGAEARPQDPANGVGAITIAPTNTGEQPAAAGQTAPSNTVGAAGGGLLMRTQSEVQQFRATLQHRLDALPAARNEAHFILRASSPTGEISAFVSLLLWSLLFFAIGVLVEFYGYGYYIARRVMMPRIQANPQGYLQKLPYLVMRFIMGVIGVAVSMLTAFAIGAIVFGPQDDTAVQFTIVVINIGYAACRLGALLWRLILAPYLGQYRIPCFSDKDAKRLFVWLVGLASLDVISQMFSIWMSQLGLNYDVYAIMTMFFALFISALNIALALFNGAAISRAIRGGLPHNEVEIPLQLVSRLWLPGLIFYVVFAWLELSFDLVLERPVSIPLLAGAYAILISILVVYATINYWIERIANHYRIARAVRKRAEQEAEYGPEGAPAAGPDEDAQAAAAPDLSALAPHLRGQTFKMRTFEDLARRVAGAMALIAGVVACLWIWGLREQMLNNPRLESLPDIIITLMIGYILYNSFRIWIDNKIEEEGGDVVVTPGDEGGGEGVSRLATLLPLFRNFVLAVIALTILLILLMELGINVSPLFAGAGVVGLAIGFGAQSLVRDIFSGAFFLFDDSFRKGEYIDIGSVKGTVEKISLRSFQLRHHLGPLHTIPFGEIQYLTNYSRDWVMMKLPLRVTYDTDVEKVRKIIKNLGQDLLKDPTIGDNFLQPLKSQGVIEMQDSAMIIRVKFMTKPGDQWLVRKKVFQEIRNVFEREGIKFAHREVTVRIAPENGEELTESQKQKAVAAASEAAIAEHDKQASAGGSERGDDR